MSNVAYKRVSTTDQNTERQLADCGVEFARVFEDSCSGGSTNRPALQALSEYIREGDTVHVHSIDRLARDLSDLRKLITNWKSQGISVQFHKEGLLFSSQSDSAMDNLMLNMLGAVAEFERSMIKERQAEGIAIAKAKGKYKGRKPVDVAQVEQVKKLINDGVSVVAACKQVGIGKATFYRNKA